MAGFGSPGFDPETALYWQVSPTVMVVTAPGDPDVVDGVEVPLEEAMGWLGSLGLNLSVSAAAPDVETGGSPQ